MAVRCPKCPGSLALLVETKVGRIASCTTCRGTWVDRGHVTLSLGRAGAATQDPQQRSEGGRSPWSCPNCSHELWTHTIKSCPEVPFEACPSCGGLWLDAAEAGALTSAARGSRSAATPSPAPEPGGISSDWREKARAEACRQAAVTPPPESTDRGSVGREIQPAGTGLGTRCYKMGTWSLGVAACLFPFGFLIKLGAGYVSLIPLAGVAVLLPYMGIATFRGVTGLLSGRSFDSHLAEAGLRRLFFAAVIIASMFVKLPSRFN